MLRIVLLAESDAPAEAALAARAIATHHPEAEVTWLLCDPRPGLPSTSMTGGEVRYAADELIDGLRYGDFVLGLSLAAARWAAVAAVVGSLLECDPNSTVVVLPATSLLLGSLDELVARADGGALLLPVHFAAASGASSGGWIPDVGVFGPRSATLVSWWGREAGRLVRDVDAPPDAVASPWATFLDRSADLAVVGEGRFRLGPSNADELRLTTAADGSSVLVDGRPAVLVGFPAFDPHRPWWFVTDDEVERPSVLVSDHPALRLLCQTRARDLLAAGWTPPLPGTRDPLMGWRPGPTVRRAYRERLADPSADALPPNPFAAGEVADFVTWVTSVPERSETEVSLVADDLWSARPDLSQTFHSVKWRDRDRFARWLWTSALAEGAISPALLPDPPRSRPAVTAPGPASFGVNLVGYHGSDAGLGVAVRRVAAALDAAGVPWVEVRYDRTSSRQRGRTTRSVVAPHRFNLILITADQLPFFVDDVGPEFFEDRYNIGIWYWETDVMTARQRSSLAIVDEVWAATEYLRAVFSRHTDKPVEHVPIPLVFPPAPSRSEARELLGFDDRFTFLFTFDFLSIADRKNPAGLLEAYRRAFPDPAGTRLILKSINGDVFIDEKEALLDATADVPGAELWDRYLDGDERHALVAAADCYVSLHRSEGLGLTIAEAMAAATPVIATRYSGSLDFTDDDCALLVDCEEVEIGEGHFYPADGHWADPDLDHAAALMRRIVADPSLAERLATNGRRSIERFTAPRVGDVAARRLRALWHA